MICLPGLTLATGRPEARQHPAHLRPLHRATGCSPTIFPSAGAAPQYNTADATLLSSSRLGSLSRWHRQPRYRCVASSPCLPTIVDWHRAGTRYGIRVDPADGLLHAGEPGVQLTWMDAKVGDWVVTPRIGKPVEINALWYNALRVMEKLNLALGGTCAAVAGLDLPDFSALAEHAKASFRERFWYDAGGYLYDVLDGPDGDDASLRPNQVLALSLQPDLLTMHQARSVLKNRPRKAFHALRIPHSLAARPALHRALQRRPACSVTAHTTWALVWAWLLGPTSTPWQP